MFRYLQKMHLFLLLVFLGASEIASAQYMEFEWSDEFRFTNKKTGFFTEFLGANQTSVYLLQRNISKSKPYDNSKIMLVALNRNSLTGDTLRAIKGFKENESQAEKLNSLDYVKSVVLGGNVVVFWRQLTNTDSTRKEEIYAQTFKSDLKPALPLKKVFEFTQEVDSRASIYDPSRCVVLSNQDSDKIVLGTELFKDGKMEFYYLSMNSQLSPFETNTVALERKSKQLPDGLTASYDLGSNDILYIRSKIFYTKEELWGLPMGHSKSYLSLTAEKVETGEHTQLRLESPEKTITDYSYKSVGGKTRILGFFGDLSKDTTGADKQGVFYADINEASLSTTDINFVYFDRSTINRLFPKKRLRKRQKETTTQEEILQTRFDIEHIEAMNDSSTVVFFTSEYNREEKTSRSNLNGENIYSTEYFFKKRDIFAIRFSDEGEVKWARSIERKASYEGADVADIRIVFKHNKFILLYGNEDAELVPPKRGKKFKHLTEELEYATFDPNSGRAKTYTTPVNEPKTEKRDKRYLDPNSAIVIGDQFYFYKMRVRQNPLWTAANVVFVPTVYYSILSGNTKLGKGDFTMMRVMEGKRPRKRR